jgi:hypothetical protein
MAKRMICARGGLATPAERLSREIHLLVVRHAIAA